MGWVARLDNDEVIEENPSIPGELSAWQALLKYCRENGLSITELSLTVGSVTVFAMSYRKCRGYMQARESALSLNGHEVVQMQGIGSIIDDTIYITWINLHVSQDGTHKVYQDTRPLSVERIHTTLSQEGDTWTSNHLVEP